MIESLADHGVDPADLVPALMATHTVKNPEFDPEAKRRADLGMTEEAKLGAVAEEAENKEDDDPAPPYEEAVKTPPAHQPESVRTPSPTQPVSSPRSSEAQPGPSESRPRSSTSTMRPMPSLFDDGEDEPLPQPKPSSRQSTTLRPMPSLFDDDDGDIGGALSPSPLPTSTDDDGDIGSSARSAPRTPQPPVESPGSLDPGPTPDRRSSSERRRSSGSRRSSDRRSGESRRSEEGRESPSKQHEADDEASQATPKPEQAALDSGEDFQAMPALPGVSTSLTSADEMVTLDIRWTVVSSV